MTSQKRVFGSLGFFMSRQSRSIAQMLVPLLAFVALANLGCTTSIAATYPHLDRRSVCLRVPGIEADASEFVFTPDYAPISNLHPEVVDRVAPTARTVFEYDPNADPDSVRYLPAPYNELTCPQRFSMLPSGEPQTSPLPEASLDLLVHERRPEIVPRAVAEKLASCVSQSSGQTKPIEHTMSFNVYVTNESRAVSALMAESTLGNRKVEACMVGVLRTTSWPGKVDTVAAAPAAPAAPFGARAFFAQPAPAVPVPDSGPESGVRLRIPAVEPSGEPGGFRIPYVGVLRFAAPVFAGGLVFVTITLLPNVAAPQWLDEMNPITWQPYTSLQEYEAVHRLSPQEILQRQLAHFKATHPQAPPAAAPTPTPSPQAQPEIAATRLRPAGSSPCPPCPTPPPNASRRDTSHKHWPCNGEHTHYYRYEYNQNPKTCQCFLKEIETHVECH